MIRPPPRSTRTDTPFPDTTLFRSLEIAAQRGFVGEAQRDQADGGGGRDVRGAIVDEHRFARCDAEAADRERVDRGIGLHQFLVARDDHVTEAIEQMRLTRAARRPERSEERGEGKEGGRPCRSRWSPDHKKKNTE